MTQTTFQNQLLRLLSFADLALLGELEKLDTGLRDVLEPAGKSIRSIYFPETGFASVVADVESPDPIEIGLIGPEGMTGIAVVLGDTRSPFETFIQAEGVAWKIDAARLRSAMTKSDTLQTILMRYARTFLTQVASTAAANARSSIEERLARWLVMIEDRMGHSFPMTHDLLSIMLAVHRTGVTLALQGLEARHLIRTTRGNIEVIDRKGLIATSRGAYGLAEKEYLRLFPKKAQRRNTSASPQ